nr:MAG TPA: hypothetical protein [Caudoviricetes sp.]
MLIIFCYLIYICLYRSIRENKSVCHRIFLI